MYNAWPPLYPPPYYSTPSFSSQLDTQTRAKRPAATSSSGAPKRPCLVTPLPIVPNLMDEVYPHEYQMESPVIVSKNYTRSSSSSTITPEAGWSAGKVPIRHRHQLTLDKFLNGQAASKRGGNMDMDMDMAERCLQCTYCKAAMTSSCRCGFCEKTFCLGARCTAQCDICNGSFCRTCSMISYSMQFERTICIDCCQNHEL
jgi:hypothetical protein